MNDLSPHTPYASQTDLSSSAISVNGRPNFSMNLSCRAAESALTPITTAFFAVIASCASRKPHASLLQPGVLSFG